MATRVETPGNFSREIDAPPFSVGYLTDIPEAQSSWREKHSTSTHQVIEMMHMSNASTALGEKDSNEHGASIEGNNKRGDADGEGGSCTL